MVIFVKKDKEKKPKKEKPPKPKYNMWQNSWYMIKLAWSIKEKKVPLLCLAVTVLAVASNLVNLYISPAILGALERKASLTELLLTILLFVGGIMLLSALTAYVNQNTMFGRITVRCELLAQINDKACHTSYSNLDDQRFSMLFSKSLNSISGNQQATEAIWNTLTSLWTNLIGFIIYLFLLSRIPILLLCVILATTLLQYFVNRRVNGYAYRHRDEQAKPSRETTYLNSITLDWTAAKDIRIFGLRPWIEELYQKGVDTLLAFSKKQNTVQLIAHAVNLVTAFLRNGIAYAYLIYMVVSGGLSVAEFLLLFTAVQGFTSWVSGILDTFNTLYTQSLEISTVREYLDYSEPFTFDGGVPLSPESETNYELKLENVSFRYPGAEFDTLTNINLTLHPGEKLAVVGLNGAGKTTLIKLMCGFYDPTEGRVLLNGIDIRTYNRADYYSMFSAVFQNFSLLAATIAVNIAQNDREINMDRVKACADKAGLLNKIEILPDGFNTYLNREVYDNAIMLSGGETQRLMLARALYKDAPFVILDEPTAALDPIAESEMYQKYNEMTKGKSSVYISHRLASTRFCDRIIYIENSVIREEGTHEELIRRGGRYAELFAVQSQYYQEGDEHHEESAS